ncbi:MAG TPA: hypothetical protein V6D18_20605 [Thermosynechococcaceae cyanobacterium]
MSFFRIVGIILGLSGAIILVSLLNGLYWIAKVALWLLQGTPVATRATQGPLQTQEASQEDLQSSAERKYQICFSFDWSCDSPFWSNDDLAYAKFGSPIRPEALGLSTQTSGTAYALADWHNTALNWTHPLDPGPWRQEECDRFNAAVDALLATVRAELGEEFEVVDRQGRYGEDPDLDRYLADPKGFRR